ncbi:MAG: hypothetical protein GDA46_00865 [Bdellovibrionales bacterium]|nr:hypothetical protein [Bdellovibrionales bacterium]
MGSVFQLRAFSLHRGIYSLPAYFIVFALLSPFAFFLFNLRTWEWSKDFNFLYVFAVTVFQATVSSLLCLILALFSSQGLLAFSKKKYYFLIEALVLIPALIPPLILALSLVHLVEKISVFPFGLPILIFSQAMTYLGLCSVAMVRIIMKHSWFLSEWAYLHKVSNFLFFKTLLKTVLLKDIKTLFILVFTSVFTSLSLPLLLGGSSFYSLEFFIYEKLKDPQLWSQAFSLILFQCVFVFFICWKVFSSYSFSEERISFKKVHLLENPFFISIPFLAVFFSVGGLFLLFDLSAFNKLKVILPLIVKGALNSFFVSFLVAVLTLFFLIGLSLSYQHKKIRKFIASFTSPGVSFLGFALLLVPFYNEVAVGIKWVVGLTLLLFPWIFRFRGERALERLDFQVETARFLGADEGLIFKKILWPVNRSLFFLCSGIVAFWACGDFSYSLIVSGGHWNLSLLVYDLFSSYRLNEAVLLSWLLLFVSFFVFMIWLALAWLYQKVF